MDNRKYWIEIAEYDLETALILAGIFTLDLCVIRVSKKS